jgi:DNA-binding MarR family transcriptional regulator
MTEEKDNIDDIIEKFLRDGILEISGIEEETGLNTYKITEKGKKIIPVLESEKQAAMNSIAFSLWSKNMINLNFDKDGNPIVALNKNSFDEEKIAELSSEERLTLRQFVDIIKQKGV